MKISIGMLLLGSCLWAQAAQAENTAPSRDPDEMICKLEAKTGTRFRTKVCMTRKERDAIAEAQKRDMAEAINGPVINPKSE